MMTGAPRHSPLPGPPRAMLLDAMGTLVRLDDPAGRLFAGLSAAGWRGTREEAARALAVEIAFYRRHIQQASDAAALGELRDAATGVLAAGLTAPPGRVVLRRVLLESVRPVANPDGIRLLHRCRAGRVPVAVVSNWDVGLAGHLERCGLAAHVSAVVTSAEVGVEKPHPGIFREALAVLGVGAPGPDVVHCGDDPERDRFGACALGLRGVLLDRRNRYPGVRGRVRSLDALGDLCGLAER